MSTIAELAILRGAVWAILVYFAIRHRSWLSLCVVGFAWAANALTALDHPHASGVVGIGTASLIVFLLIDRLDKNPVHVKHVATRQVTDARREMHDAMNERAAWEARYHAAERVLRDHNIRF